MQDRRTVLSQQVAVLTVEINLLAVKHVRQKCFRLWNCLCDVSHRQSLYDILSRYVLYQLTKNKHNSDLAPILLFNLAAPFVKHFKI
jgi:hypothetical protein